jgi:hypothetical protein
MEDAVFMSFFKYFWMKKRMNTAPYVLECIWYLAVFSIAAL